MKQVVLTFVRRVLKEIDEFGNVRELGVCLSVIGCVQIVVVYFKGFQEVPVCLTNMVVVSASSKKPGIDINCMYIFLFLFTFSIQWNLFGLGSPAHGTVSKTDTIPESLGGGARILG